MSSREAENRESPGEPIRIGISACLLGDRVRFDGGHKRDSYISDILARFVEFVPVCPEVDIGLGAPREPIRLERRGSGTRLVAPGSGADHTRAMEAYARKEAARLEKEDLCGYILKNNSPSCGLFRVRVHGPGGVASRDGRGLFATALVQRLPLLPVEEEGRLKDPRLRENFIERVFAYYRLRKLFAPRWRLRDLVSFHASEKLLLLAHDPKLYGVLGRLVGEASKRSRTELARLYREQFMTALARLATPGKVTNVLQHMAGYLKKRIGPGERAELASLIAEFRRGLVPLVVPVTLIRHHVRAHGIEYLAGQTFLEPHPKELMLRNHV